MTRRRAYVLGDCFAIAVFCGGLGLLLPLANGDTQREKDLAAQHTRDQETIDRLTAESAAASNLATRRTVANAAAIKNLGAQGDAHAQENQRAVAAVQGAVESTKSSADSIKTSTDQVAAKVDALVPIDYRPIWIAAISAFVTVFGVIGSISIAWITRRAVAVQGTTIDKVHALTNSAMEAALEGTATARRANANSVKVIYNSEKTEENKVAMETAERLAQEAEQKFAVHQQTQEALNKLNQNGVI